MKHITLFLFAFIALASCTDNLNISITNPNVEQQTHEQPLATAQPRFSWNYGTDRRSDEENQTTESEVMQQNYRIIVASTMENAQKASATFGIRV